MAREFFNTRKKVIEYLALTLYHPAFGYARFVANQFYEKELGGNTFQPCSMLVSETVLDERGSISYEIQLGRVGSSVKEYIKAVNAYPLGWMIAVEGTVEYYLSTDTTTPHRTPVTLSIGDITLDADAAVMTLDSGNPRSSKVSKKYNTTEYPGTGASI